MFEFVELIGSSCVFRAPTNLGVVRVGGGVVVIDSGYGDDKVRRLLKVLGGVDVVALVNTHSHADHVGGNRFLVKRTGARVYAPRREGFLVEFPDVYMRMFFNQAFPPVPRGERFMVHRSSRVDFLLDAGSVEIGGEEFVVVDLPGHSFGQVGVLTGDGVFYIGDAVFTVDVLEKYPLIFYVDIGDLFRSFDVLLKSGAELFVAGHGEVLDRAGIRDTIKVYVERVEEVNSRILEIASKPMSFEDIVSLLIREFNVPLSFEQFYLTKTIVSAHLSWLFKNGKLDVGLREGRMVFKTV